MKLSDLKTLKPFFNKTVDEWIEAYRNNRETATLELLQFFVACSGCKGKITLKMRRSMDNAKIVTDLTDQFDDSAGGAYPLVMSGPQWKKFKVHFCDFIGNLMRQCQYSIIYDEYLMESIISFLITLSDSQVRAFRHTATCAALKLMTALVDIALTLSVSIDNTQRQLDKVRQEKVRGERLDNLVAKRQELDGNMEDIKTMLGYLFKSIYVHRYRDIVPEIRGLCVTEIGIWMAKFPNHFLDDSYLKYVGWTLFDKVGYVRLKSLQSLVPLYETEEIADEMELFTHKFKERIIAMTSDKEPEVAAQAIKLIISIFKQNNDVLTDKDCIHVYELVYATNRGVAQAAGEFLNEKLFKIDENATDELYSRRGKKRSVHTPLIRDLITFFIESEIHEHGAYLVDSLIESHPMMKDWECMTDLLLEEPGADEEALDDRHETVLIEIMVCAIKQSATGECPVGRIPSRKQLSNKESKQLFETKSSITKHFIVTLPLLLDKYKTDTEKIANLMTIPQYFDLSHYAQDFEQLESLLKLINELIDIHSDSEVLETCAKAYEYLYDDDFAFKRDVWVSKSLLLDNLVLQKYKKAVRSFTAYPDGRDEREDVVINLKKLAALISCLDLNLYEIWKIVFENFIRGIGSENADNVPEDAIKYSINICYYSLIWSLHDSKSNSEVGSEENYSEVRNRLADFVAELRILLSYPSEEIAREAYFTLCDLLIIFGPHLKTDEPSLPSLVFRPTQSLIDKMIDFLNDNVFKEDNQDESDTTLVNSAVRDLYIKRQVLAGFCKLIIYGIIPINYVICIVRHYVTFFNNFGDIFKLTVIKLREKDKILCGRTMASALIQIHKELLSEAEANSETLNKDDENFLSLKELAKRLATVCKYSFNLDFLST
ncbi:cohesin subunit SA-1 [Tetranychus urticae]|uniref:SCD domain-containing protein n=1 Tax=Tetranychus urticae TaxID=32264 RepID=T1KP19_TETUR|nr:cohesin subunit SA-1 [Tetranychus urticae]